MWAEAARGRGVKGGEQRLDDGPRAPAYLPVAPHPQQVWRTHFVLEENMLEVECPAVTPEVVLKVRAAPAAMGSWAMGWCGGCRVDC